jgi:uncharacterized protein DUF955
LTPTLPDDVQPLVEQVIGCIEAQGIVVEERPLPTGVDGASTGGTILLRPGLDSRTKLFVALHELGHELAHRAEEQRQKPIAQREREAEATSFVVAAALGLDNVGSRDYLLQYQATPEQVRQSLGTIQALSRHILAIIDDVVVNEVAPAA